MRCELFADTWRKSVRLAPKDQPVADLVADLGVKLLSEFGEEPSPLEVHFCEHQGPGIDYFDIQELPIIQSCSLDEFFIEPKSHRPNDPKLRIERYARPSNISSVLRDFRLKKNDVERGFTQSDFGHNGPLANCKIGYNSSPSFNPLF